MTVTGTHNKPLTAHGLTSYRYRGRYGYVMIGARNHDDALNEAGRSIKPATPDRANLEIWNGAAYESI